MERNEAAAERDAWEAAEVDIFLPPLFLLFTMGWNADAILGDLFSLFSRLLLACFDGEALLLLLWLCAAVDLRGHSVHSTRNLVTASRGTNA